VVVGSPAYLAARGIPVTPEDLARHNCLSFGNYGNQARGWLLQVDGSQVPVRVGGNLECNDGAVLHDWAIAGHGLAWRSMWEVAEDLKAGRLQTVLDEFAAPGNAIHAVFPQRRHLPLRVRMFVDHLKNTYGDPAYWGV
jgi:DNA-binding transcriptional LysR family regulator